MERNEAQLRCAIAQLHLQPEELAICDAAEAARIVDSVKRAFVRDPDPRWWWASLRVPAALYDFPEADAFRHLLEFVPLGETRCWLIVENDEDGPWHVADAALAVVPGVIAECGPFEYYVVGKRFNWLIAENHHNQLVVAGPA